MSDSRRLFAQRLRDSMERAGYAPRPAVLEREFNTRYWGKPMTLHGVRRWLLGETMPSNDKIKVLAEWLGEAPQDLGFGQAGLASGGVRENVRPWGPVYGYQEREIVEAFLTLPVSQRRVVREVILTFAREAAREREKLETQGRNAATGRPSPTSST
jgi:hypothetical protein